MYTKSILGATETELTNSLNKNKKSSAKIIKLYFIINIPVLLEHVVKGYNCV